MTVPPWIIRKQAEKILPFFEAGIKGFEWKIKESRLSKAVRKVFVRENLGYMWFSVQGARLLIRNNF